MDDLNALSKREISRLRKIISLAQMMIQKSSTEEFARGATSGKKRIRRTGRELVAFRKMLKAERKKGTPVADVARKHGVSLAYVYTL